MRSYARSENNRKKIVRKLLGDPAEAEIGSRVFPLRSPPPASMPSVGTTRRSTRVFVPKAAARPPAGAGGDGGETARILRSGKRLSLSKPVEKEDGDDWLRKVFGSPGDAADLQWWKEEKENGGLRKRDQLSVPETDAKALPIEMGGQKERFFGKVYSRKRQRLTEDDSGSFGSSLGSGTTDEGRMYGIVFSRKPNRKKPKVAPLVQVGRELARIKDRECEDESRRMGRSGYLKITDSATNFAGKVGISDDVLCTWLGSPMVLAVLVECLSSRGSYQLACLLVPIMRWMRRARVRLWDLAAFLLSGTVARVFSSNGIHFLPLRRRKNQFLLRNSMPGCGFCKIYGAREFDPILSLDFSALPSYFMSLHAVIIHRSQYLPRVLARGSMGLLENITLELSDEECDFDARAETGFSGIDATVSESPAVGSNEINNSPSVIEARVSSVARLSTVMNGSRFRSHQKKRSSLRKLRASCRISVDSRVGKLHFGRNSPCVSPAAKAYALRNSHVDPARVKLLDSCLTDLLDDMEGSDVASTPSRSKHRKSAKKSLVERIREHKSAEQIKEEKLALAEVKQNIDTVRCKANILVTVADRCWREDAAEIMLEMSGSNEWCLAVKKEGMVRYLHKPQELKPCVVNRFTHAYMWSGDDSWKLEFFEKWEWAVFKELHLECRQRNINIQDASVRIIPVPGVREVSGYEDNATPSFVRPDVYIHAMVDEIGRALASETAYYDMDAADEEWLNHLNSSFCDVEDFDSSHMSEDNFERMIFTLEKDAYSHPDGISKDRAVDICQNLGKRDVLAAVYDYWLKKRKQKRTALVKVFQGPPLRKTQLIPKPILRKKRSFKRPRSHVGRGKPEFFFDVEAQQEAIRRVEEAEAAASRAADAAVHLRSRAQLLMANADLAVYRAAMAVRIAEAVRLLPEESSDFVVSSALLD